jgi:hypothetical protein
MHEQCNGALTPCLAATPRLTHPMGLGRNVLPGLCLILKGFHLWVSTRLLRKEYCVETLYLDGADFDWRHLEDCT